MFIVIVFDIIHIAKIAYVLTVYNLKLCAKGSFLYVFSVLKALFININQPYLISLHSIFSLNHGSVTSSVS